VEFGIRTGNPANLTVLRIKNTEVIFYDSDDSEGQKIKGNKLIIPEMTFINGKLLYRRNKEV